MGAVETLSLALGVGWASGINLYAAVLTLGLLGSLGHLDLPPSLEVLQDPVVIGVAAFLYVVEFLADKIPGVDSVWDAIHTFIRLPAGAALAAGAAGELSPAIQIAAALAGGTLAAGSHATKAGSRAMINSSPEPFSNWLASLFEDVLVIGGVWTALLHPWLFLAGLAVFVGLAIWLLPRIGRGLKRIFAALRRPFQAAEPEARTPPARRAS